MTRMMLAVGFIAMATPAFADETRVRTSASVEVLDDKAQIDDVISRVRQQQAEHAASQASAGSTAANATNTATLKAERPPAPATLDASHRSIAPEAKEPRPGSRKHNIRTANPATERPHVIHRR